ncbi:hypothetical protein DYB28_002133 [Aphanomyces astaci]|uniref:STE/STE11 protein kinase n=1 Tax=Aphanomyces astaci TaxID=112090 RepID=A0A9X8DYJ8_APHAT|nr:hypothetical protein DYB28_002133 [Aphanomyces astaci]
MDAFIWQRGKLIGRGRYGKVYVGILLSTYVHPLHACPSDMSCSATMMAVKQVRVRDESGLDEIEGTFVPVEEESIESIMEEVRIGRSLYHPHVVEYYGAEQDGNIFNLFMEYLPLGSISGLLKGFGPLDESMVAAYTYQLLQGLVYLHSRGIAHRDLKCANLLLSDSGCLKIADFGAAKESSSHAIPSTHTRTSIQDEAFHHSSSQDGGVGSPYWMSPEIIRADGRGSDGWTKSDIWSVGCCVIEMATGTPPWVQHTYIQYCYMVIMAACQSNFSNPLTAMFHIASDTAIPEIPPHVSHAARGFLTQCFVKDPSVRPTAESLLSNSFFASVPPFGPHYRWFNDMTKPLDGGSWWLDQHMQVWTYGVRGIGGWWLTTEDDGAWTWQPDMSAVAVEIATYWLSMARQVDHRNPETPKPRNPETPKPRTPETPKPWRTVRVVADYIAADDTELSLAVNDLLVVKDMDESGWWLGTDSRGGGDGWFPCTYVEWVDGPSAETGLGVVRALGEYEPTTDGELRLTDQDLVLVLEAPPDGWWRGRLVVERGEADGWFPCTYVEWLPVVVATWTSSKEDEDGGGLKVQRGDRVAVVTADDENGWTLGLDLSNGQQGWFPTSYLTSPLQLKQQDSEEEEEEEYVVEYLDE